MQNLYDIIVIGAGAGGLVIAIGGAKAGKKVLLIEKGAYGGDCTNYGCIPSKSLIASAKNAHAFTLSKQLGIKTSPFSIDGSGALERVRAIISEVRSQEDPLALNQLGVETLNGTARFQDAHTLSVDGKLVKGKQIVIATGSIPFIPNISGLENTPFLTNETVFDLKKKPKTWYLGPTAFGHFRNFVRSRLTKIIFFQDDSIFFLYLLKHFGDNLEGYGSRF